MSLTITINRVEGGRFRAEVADRPDLVIEMEDLTLLVFELKRTLDTIAVAPDGSLLLLAEKVDTAARAVVEKPALRNEELDELIDRFPVPPDWGSEPGWSDDV
jgi:ribosome biogenesis GTPase A